MGVGAGSLGILEGTRILSPKLINPSSPGLTQPRNPTSVLSFLQPWGHHLDSPKRPVSPPPRLSLLTLSLFMSPEGLYPPAWLVQFTAFPRERGG